MINEKNWARELSQGLIDLNQLVKKGFISMHQTCELKPVIDHFNIRVPHIFLEEIEKSNEAISSQFLPSSNELNVLPEQLTDPIGDERWSPVAGITHRYPDRVLFKPTYMCASYCRFCFRRYKVSDSSNNLKKDDFLNAYDYIKKHSEIWEVIITGGDPLTLTDQSIASILENLSEIDHVKVIRFHTRILSVLPSRITMSLLDIFKKSNKSIWIAAHINSADEFTLECKNAIAKCVDNGIPILLQSVLLKGINDSHEKLISLFKKSIENRIKPYYLHYPDLAKGTEHFRIPLRHAIELIKNLRGKISGLCIPQLIVDIPGGEGKIAMHTHNATEVYENVWEFESSLNSSRIVIKYPNSI